MASTTKARALKADRTSDDIARVVGARKPVTADAVDFGDVDRPKTCLEVDFPILPINQIATIEGNAGKPIYQMSKWWARRRSSVFRSMLIASSMKAPADSAQSGKAVWDAYYGNHQARAGVSGLKVADIFMGGGTTLVEAARLGMQAFGVDLNPVAWFVVKNELARIRPEDVEAVLAHVEREVRPQIMPFFACDCPRGHKGTWTEVATGQTMDASFDPLALEPGERNRYTYSGPEVIYTFWAKHGPCQVTGCGHRTPIISSPVMAVKTISVKAWLDVRCSKCLKDFDVEEDAARMAPGVPLAVAQTERPFSILDRRRGVRCPHCEHQELRNLGKGKNKKVELSLLVHPEWLSGSPRVGPDGAAYGGTAISGAESTIAWSRARAERSRLLEVRGALPEVVTCPETGASFRTDVGTVPKKSTFACQAPTCGRVQDILESVKASGANGPMAAYAIQGYCPRCDEQSRPYGGRFFAPASVSGGFEGALREWERRKEADLSAYWPRSEVPFGFMTSLNNGGIPNHGYTHWWKMFNERQLLVLSQLLKAITSAASPEETPARE